MARLNKSTGLFGMGGGKRKGAKSKFRDFLDQRRKGKASRMQAKRFKKMSDQERYESMMAAKQRRADFMASRAKSAPMAKPAASATTSTTRDVMTKEESRRIMDNNERAMLNRKNKANAKVGEMFEIIDSKGKKQKVMKKKAMYGSKVKAVKKAKNGGALKSVPSDAKGLSKLPKSVRNKMGYMKNGGKVGDPKKFTTMRSKNSKTGEIEYFKLSGGESTDGGKTYAPSVKTKISKAEYDSMMGLGKARQKTATKMKNGGKVGSKMNDLISQQKALQEKLSRSATKASIMKSEFTVTQVRKMRSDLESLNAKIKELKGAGAGTIEKATPLGKRVGKDGKKLMHGGKVKKVKKKDKKSLETAQKALERRAQNSKLQNLKDNPTRIGNTHRLNASGRRKKAFTDMEGETIARGVAKKEGRTYVSEGSRKMNTKSIGKIPTMKSSTIKSLKKGKK